MRERPIGLTALALASVVVGLYGMASAIALILGASIGAIVSPDNATGAFLVGIVAFGLAFAAFFVGGGFWLQKRWAWAGGIVIFATAIVVSLAMVAIGGGLIAALAIAVAVGVALAYLMRPSIKAELLGPAVAVADEPAA